MTPLPPESGIRVRVGKPLVNISADAQPIGRDRRISGGTFGINTGGTPSGGTFGSSSCSSDCTESSSSCL